MKQANYLIVWVAALGVCNGIEWTHCPLDNLKDGVRRELHDSTGIIYTFVTGAPKEHPERRTTSHKFLKGSQLVLEILETAKQDDLYLGNSCKTYPDAKVPTETWDYNKDGVIDVVRIGALTERDMQLYGRYRNGVFGLVPPDLNFTQLWDYLKTHDSEPGADGNRPSAGQSPDKH